MHHRMPTMAHDHYFLALLLKAGVSFVEQEAQKKSRPRRRWNVLAHYHVEKWEQEGDKK